MIVIEDIIAFISSATFPELIRLGQAIWAAIEGKGADVKADVEVLENAADVAENAKVGS